MRNFYTAALTAGARPHGSPATRDSENGVFNAAVLDFDGNSIEVMYRENVDPMDDSQSVGGFSRVLTWRKSVSGSLRDEESVVSGSSVKTATRTVVPYQPPKSAGPGSVIAPSVKAESVAPSVARTQSAPIVPRVSKEELNPELMADAGARKIIGTLIGAAAGAAVAYAMVKSERDSAKEEKAAIAASQAASQKAPSVKAPSQKASSVAPSQQQYQQSEYAFTPSQVQQMIQYERAPTHRNFSETESMYSAPHQRMAIEAAPARSTHAPTLVSALQSGVTTVKQATHRNFSETESMYSSADSRDRYSRALENAPQTAKSYLNPTCVSVAQTSASKRNEDVEYIPASSVGPRSTYSRKSSAPSVISEMPKSSRAPSQAPSKALSQSPSKSGSKAPSLISSFHPDDDDRKSNASERRSSAPSAHSSRSKADRLDSVDESAERRSSAGSVRSSKSKAKSLISSFAPDQDRNDYPPTPPKSTAPSAVERRSSANSVHSTKSKAQEGGSGSKAPSLLGSLLRRNKDGGDGDDGPSDLDTVAPSDSISNAGSSRSSLRRGSSRANEGDDDAKSSHSRHSKHSKHSSSSKHSSKSRRERDDDDDRKSHHSSRSHKSSSSRRSERKEEDVVRPSNISEPSDASTVKPYKPRKDSVVSLPTRKLEKESEGRQRSVVSFAG